MVGLYYSASTLTSLFNRVQKLNAFQTAPLSLVCLEEVSEVCHVRELAEWGWLTRRIGALGYSMPVVSS